VFFGIQDHGKSPENSVNFWLVFIALIYTAFEIIGSTGSHTRLV
jgi:hypothetical protein